MHMSFYYSVTAHHDDGQARPKHVGVTNWENIYHLCILLDFISNYSLTYLNNQLETFTPLHICNCFQKWQLIGGSVCEYRGGITIV
jgi:hypothetical protein